MKRKIALTITALAMALAFAIPASAALAKPPSPSPSLSPTPLPNGLTAAIVAKSGQKITGSYLASSSDNIDVGIYIGPGVHDVTVNGATVSGFNDEGILVQDASDIVIQNSTISNNANTSNTHAGYYNTSANLTEDKAIVLAGTTDCLVKDDTITGNGAGGVSVLDDGPNHPFALETVPPHPISGIGNVIMGNTIENNDHDCGIVVAAKNPDGGVYDNLVSKNIITTAVGGIVVAGGAGQTRQVEVINTNVLNNVVTGSVIPGISLHAFGLGVIDGTHLTGNVLTNNGFGEISGNTTGIEIFAVSHVGIISNTQILHDSIHGDVFAVFHVGDTGTHVANLTTDSIPPVFPPIP